jgi:urease accessory protein UreF
MLDVVDTEAAEKSIDHVIAARSRSQEEANHNEAMWKESTRRFNQTRHQEYARGWYEHHSRQIASLEATLGVLVAHHKAERNRFARMLGISIPDDGAGGPPPGEA